MKKIALIAPSSPIKASELQVTLSFFQKHNLAVVPAKNCLKKEKHLAGNDSERSIELLHFLSDPTVDCLWCVRGGAGSYRLLELVSDACISTKKMFIGMSDATALLQAFQSNSKIETILGPNAHHLAKTQDEKYQEQILNQLANGFDRFESKLAYEECWSPGKAKGRLIGGNLALLCSLIGTKYLERFQGCILAIEDVNEPGYRIDRMLWQLKSLGFLDNLKGCILGKWKNCPNHEDVLYEYFSLAPYPVVYGAEFGHIEKQQLLKIGEIVELEVDPKKKDFRIHYDVSLKIENQLCSENVLRNPVSTT